MAIALSGSDVERLRRSLADLLARSEADSGVVCDSGGYVLAQAGRGDADASLLCALGAGVFGASRELAGLLGEDEFSAVLHQGERRSILLRAVTPEVLLVVIFTSGRRVGLVRLYAAPAAAEMRAVLAGAARGGGCVAHAEKAFVLASDGEVFRQAPGG